MRFTLDVAGHRFTVEFAAQCGRAESMEAHRLTQAHRCA